MFYAILFQLYMNILVPKLQMLRFDSADVL